MKHLSLSVLIPFHHISTQFFVCLEAVLMNSTAFLELILIYDGVDTQDLELLPKHDKLNLIKTGEQKGPAYARNVGAIQAKGEILCFLDSDVKIPSNFFKRIKKEFSLHSDLTALFGSYDDAPSDKAFLSQYRNLYHHYIHQQSAQQATTFWAGCGAIRRTAFLKVGGFDEITYTQPEIEDIELGYRLKKAGFTIVLVKELQVKHLKKWSAIKLIKTDLCARAIPWTRLILSKQNAPNDLNLTYKNRFNVLLNFLLFLSLIGSCLNPNLLWAMAASTGLFFLLNRQLYRFFYQKRGFVFALKVMPWQVLFYLLCGIGFILGFVLHIMSITFPDDIKEISKSGTRLTIVKS